MLLSGATCTGSGASRAVIAEAKYISPLAGDGNVFGCSQKRPAYYPLNTYDLGVDPFLTTFDDLAIEQHGDPATSRIGTGLPVLVLQGLIVKAFLALHPPMLDGWTANAVVLAFPNGLKQPERPSRQSEGGGGKNVPTSLEYPIREFCLA
jgi:hypothetical protein